jgi:hypothetical protein
LYTLNTEAEFSVQGETERDAYNKKGDRVWMGKFRVKEEERRRAYT